MRLREKIMARRAEAFGTACEFRSAQGESSNVWDCGLGCGKPHVEQNAFDPAPFALFKADAATSQGAADVEASRCF